MSLKSFHFTICLLILLFLTACRESNTPSLATTNDCIPTLVAPTANAILDNGRTDRQDNQVWDFDWEDCPGATQYELYVIHSGADIPAIDYFTTDSSYQHLAERGYVIEPNRFDWMWKVRSQVNGQWSDWSEIQIFEVEPVNTDLLPHK